jgi:hypothetical protein
MRALVVTTINSPNNTLRLLAEGAKAHDIRFLIVGDTKTPLDFELPHAEYLSLAEQVKQFPTFCSVLPTKHYARKNVGYLAAIAQGATEIQETDDDNVPYAEFWGCLPASFAVDTISADPSCAWYNVYSRFTETRIWPRGYPLQYLQSAPLHDRKSRSRLTRGLIVQGLANGNPDVDAIFRLTQELPVHFQVQQPVMLGKGVWCPFNSQNTSFRRTAFPLLYLPSYCSFRMTDIWRSFVAQRCLWEADEGVVFQSATVYQERNEHDLLRDFADEVPGYLLNDRIRCALENCSVEKDDMLKSLSSCYESLVREELLPKTELPVVAAWCAQLEMLCP